jgi:hypothetical protein
MHRNPPPPLSSPVEGEVLGLLAYADCFKITPPSTVSGRVKSYTLERRVNNG